MYLMSGAGLAIFFVVMTFGAWRIYTGQAKARPLTERASVAVICGLVGWQGLRWLLDDHSAADQSRVLAVWTQCVSGLGIAAVLILHGWIPARRPIDGR
jgi:hypothetical protein